MATRIIYDGNTTEMGVGQTATFPCAGSKAASDIVIEFEADGTIAYNAVTTDISDGQTATMACGGKKMLTDVVIKTKAEVRISGTWVGNNTVEPLASAVASGTLVSFNVNFKSNNGTSYIRISFAKNGNVNYHQSGTWNNGYVASSGWYNSYMKTINFGATPQTVDIELYRWLVANGTFQ